MYYIFDDFRHWKCWDSLEFWFSNLFWFDIWVQNIFWNIPYFCIHISGFSFTFQSSASKFIKNFILASAQTFEKTNKKQNTLYRMGSALYSLPKTLSLTTSFKWNVVLLGRTICSKEKIERRKWQIDNFPCWWYVRRKNCAWFKFNPFF